MTRKLAAVAALCLLIAGPAAAADQGLWGVYEQQLKTAKYIDLTHAFQPVQPVWPGFSNATFGAAVAGTGIPGYVGKGDVYTYEKHGFVASAYTLPTDQYGTQLDPPAHWDEYGATISDLPPTFAVRPLVVIDMTPQVQKDPGYALRLSDIEAFEKQYGQIPEGAVVFVRSDWSKKWQDVAHFNDKPFPGVGLEALKFLHLERKILFHGHEPLDTDATPTLEGEAWLLHNHFTQAEGVTNLDQVPPTGSLVTIGFAKPEGGTGGYARYIAIAPADWPHGVTIADAPGAPLPRQTTPLRRDAQGVLRPTPQK